MRDTRDEEELDGDVPALPVAEVEKLMTTVAKALRAFNMYQSNNPVFQRFRGALRDGFTSVWELADKLPLAVTEEGFAYRNSVFAVGRGRDNLAFAFYKDGVRSLTFFPGFEDEVAAFLDAVSRAMKQDQDSDDLITVLWEEDFSALQYGYVDLLMEGAQVPEGALSYPTELDASFKLELRPEQGEEGEEEHGSEASGAAGGPAPKTGLSRDDFDETLYFLDPGEMAALRTEVEVEMEREVRRDVLNALFDRLEEPGEARQTQILEIVEQLLPLFLGHGYMRGAGLILEELDRAQGDEGALGDALRERVERLFSRLSDAEVLEQFVQAVEDGAVAPDSDEVNLFFGRLHAHALPVLIRFSEMSESDSVRSRLSSAIDGLAGRYPKQVSELLTSDEPAVVRGAARVAGRMGMSQAVEGLDRALRHPDRDVRLASVEALVAIRMTTALQALITALDDEDREVRIAAAKALGAVRFASARGVFESIIDGKRIRDADLTEKMAVFEAYGAIGGTTAVERLSELLNARGFLGRRQPTEIRACAALALGQAGTPVARKALARAKSDEDSIVRNAVLRALKEEVGSR